jgi:RNA polymerase sigma factor (sigma-70 family)
MNDLELLQSCLKGDKQAWAEFILRFSRLIYNYILSVLSANGQAVSPEQLEDIFQEILHSLIKDNYKKLSTYRGKNGCSLASWLRQVSVNYTIDYLRKLRPLSSLDASNEEGFSLSDTLVDQSPDAMQLLSDRDKRQALAECIDRLDPDEQYFLELFLNQGLTLEEIREHFKIDRGAVDMRKGRILHKLHECFKKKGFFQLDFTG